MTDFRVVAIRPDVAGGVETALQIGLDEAAKEGFDLKTLIPYREGVLAVFARDSRKPLTEKAVRAI